MIDLPDREGAALVRGGDERDISRLCRLGGRVISRRKYLNEDGIAWPVAVVQLGGRRGPVVQVVLEPIVGGWPAPFDERQTDSGKRAS